MRPLKVRSLMSEIIKEVRDSLPHTPPPLSACKDLT
jgi:hypothetical protein